MVSRILEACLLPILTAYLALCFVLKALTTTCKLWQSRTEAIQTLFQVKSLDCNSSRLKEITF